MRILVVGPLGFIGSAFVRVAAARGHEIQGLVRPERAVTGLPRLPGVIWAPGTLDAPPWSEIVRFRPQSCVHAAWITRPESYRDASENFGYVQASLTLAQGLFEQGVEHFVGIGTCAEYRCTGHPLDETRSPVEPASTYARCKDALRRALADVGAQRGASVCWARLFYPYGVGEHPERLCSSIVRQLAVNQAVVLRAPQSIKDYVHVDDVATALLCLVEQRCEDVVNIGSGVGISVLCLARRIARAMNRLPLVTSAPTLIPDPFFHQVADSSRLERLGWAPAVRLDDGLRRLIDRLAA